MLVRIAVAVTALLLIGGSALGQKSVRPRADLPLREAPPGIFQSKGDRIGTAKEGEDYHVIEQTTVPTITGAERWLRVVPADSSSAPESGWIYSGPSGNPDANVKAAR